jgi:DHA1 family multidrug resistance protein-like MFS transporter
MLSPKMFLVLMTVVAVISDSLLHPFYPQYLERVFGVTEPKHVALYIAGSSLTVLACLPLWSSLAKRIHVLRLLMITQLGAAAMSLACALTHSLVWFCVLSCGMLIFKASYLLIYPYVMSLEHKEEHLGTISLLAFVVYFGNILAALLSGVMLQLLEPTSLFIAMTAGDILQTGLCSVLLRTRPSAAASGEPSIEEDDIEHPGQGFVYKLGAVMLMMYFSAYLCEPFFVSYWEQVAWNDSEILSGLVFAIPGASALCGLYWNSRRAQADASGHAGVLPAIALALCSLWLQASGSAWGLVLGRFVYGWALFQVMVRLDALLFRFSSRERYAADFSKLNLFQGLGVLSASFSAGWVVSAFGPRTTFIVSAAGFGLGAALYCGVFREQRRAVLETQPLRSEETVT